MSAKRHIITTRHDFAQKKLNEANVLIAQLNGNISNFIEMPDGLYGWEDEVSITNWIAEILKEADLHQVDLVVFPELSVPQSCQDMLRKASEVGQRIIIGGSHYAPSAGNKVHNACPIYFNGTNVVTHKLVVALQGEQTADNKIIEGTSLKVWENTPLGKLIVCICSDFLNLDIRHAVDSEEPDILVIISLQKDPARFYMHLEPLVQESKDGIFCFYVNSHVGTASGGGSSIFGGHLSDEGRKKLNAAVGFDVDSTYRNLTVKVPNGHSGCVVTVDLKTKKPPRASTVETNLPIRNLRKLSADTTNHKPTTANTNSSAPRSDLTPAPMENHQIQMLHEHNAPPYPMVSLSYRRITTQTMWIILVVSAYQVLSALLSLMLYPADLPFSKLSAGLLLGFFFIFGTITAVMWAKKPCSEFTFANCLTIFGLLNVGAIFFFVQSSGGLKNSPFTPLYFVFLVAVLLMISRKQGRRTAWRSNLLGASVVTAYFTHALAYEFDLLRNWWFWVFFFAMVATFLSEHLKEVQH